MGRSIWTDKTIGTRGTWGECSQTKLGRTLYSTRKQQRLQPEPHQDQQNRSYCRGPAQTRRDHALVILFTTHLVTHCCIWLYLIWGPAITIRLLCWPDQYISPYPSQDRYEYVHSLFFDKNMYSMINASIDAKAWAKKYVQQGHWVVRMYIVTWRPCVWCIWYHSTYSFLAITISPSSPFKVPPSSYA